MKKPYRFNVPSVDWSLLSGAEVPRSRYPQPIPGYVCRLCNERSSRTSHGCVDLTCSCSCPELADKNPPEGEFKQRLQSSGLTRRFEDQLRSSPFHGRRREIASPGFLCMNIPSHAQKRGMKIKRIRKYGHKESTSVNPYYWRLALRLEDRLISALFTRPRPWLLREVKAIRKADVELMRCQKEAEIICRKWEIPIRGSTQKWRVLKAIMGGQEDSLVIAGCTGLPPKHVSAWLSVLAAQGYIEKCSETRLTKEGSATNVWKPCWNKIREISQYGIA